MGGGSSRRPRAREDVIRSIRVLVAPSGYKESLDSEGVSAAIAEGVGRACPDADIVQLPLVDGGEGTARTLARVTGGELRLVRVCGPVGDEVEGCFALLGGTAEPTAALDLASASGLKLVPRDLAAVVQEPDPERLREAAAAVVHPGIAACDDDPVSGNTASRPISPR